MQNAGESPRNLSSYGNLNKVIAASVLNSVDIENRKPAGMTTEILAEVLRHASPNDDLTRKILSRRLG